MFDYNTIKSINKDLEKTQKDTLILFAQERLKDLFSTDYDNIFRNIDRYRNITIKENHFKNGLSCPKCGCKRVNKNGKMNNRQRYICKNCSKTFDEMSFSPLSSTKIGLDKWLIYCQLMIEGQTIRKCAKSIDVSIPTSFFMRHRILDVLNLYFENNKLEGITEVGQYYIGESFKGEHFENKIIKNRSYKRKGMNRFPSRYGEDISEKICIQTAIDRKGDILTKIACKGPVRAENVVEFFNKKIEDNVIFCISSSSNFANITQLYNLNFKIKLIRVPMNESGIIDIYNISHVNKFHRELSIWMRKFKGVATKYLNNYLVWFKFLYMSKKIKLVNTIYNLFMNVVPRNLKITKDMIKSRVIQYEDIYC